MTKSDLFLSPPIVNAAGSLGFVPDLHGPIDWKRFGGFVTNPISLEPRRPAASAVCLPYPGGFLLHSGYPNPGLRRVIQDSAAAWGRSPLPILTAILLQQLEQIPQFFESLEGLPGVAGVEISLPVDVQPGDLTAILEKAFGELAVILRLPLDRALELIPASAVSKLLENGLTAVSLGAPRGALQDAAGRVVNGRLYGPALFPQTLAVVRSLVRSGMTVIAGPGVFSAAQAELLLANGALAVQLDAVLWKDPAFQGWEPGRQRQVFAD
jgi:dihydroorotate dehydrogenase (NAD+) catalytic subunit